MGPPIMETKTLNKQYTNRMKLYFTKAKAVVGGGWECLLRKKVKNNFKITMLLALIGTMRWRIRVKYLRDG